VPAKELICAFGLAEFAFSRNFHAKVQMLCRKISAAWKSIGQPCLKSYVTNGSGKEHMSQ